jgi:hypothetical protein
MQGLGRKHHADCGTCGGGRHHTTRWSLRRSTSPHSRCPLAGRHSNELADENHESHWPCACSSPRSPSPWRDCTTVVPLCSSRPQILSVTKSSVDVERGPDTCGNSERIGRITGCGGGGDGMAKRPVASPIGCLIPWLVGVIVEIRH